MALELGKFPKRLPEPLLAAAKQLQAYGSQNQMRELMESVVSLEVANGHLFGLIASSLCQADAYYRGPYEVGAVFLLLDAPPLRSLPGASPLRFIRVFTQFISAFPVARRLPCVPMPITKALRLPASKTTLSLHCRPVPKYALPSTH
jgi:hypothetical protein